MRCGCGAYANPAWVSCLACGAALAGGTPQASAPFERREGYEYPVFMIPTPVGRYEFVTEIPKERYDPFLILELFEKYHSATVH